MASGPDRHRRRCRRERDQGGRRRRRSGPAPLGAAARRDAEPVDPGRGHRLDRAARPAAREVERARRRDPGRDRPARASPSTASLKTAANIDPAWIDFPVVERLTRLLKRPDLDHQRRRRRRDRRDALRGRQGPAGRRHLPDARDRASGRACSTTASSSRTREFGQMEIRGRAAERRSAAAARIRRGLSWKAWAADLDEHLDRIHQLIWPNLMILGGGVSKSADRFVPRLTVRRTVVPGAPAQRRRDHRCGDRRGRGADRPAEGRRSTRSATGRRRTRPRMRPPRRGRRAASAVPRRRADAHAGTSRA